MKLVVSFTNCNQRPWSDPYVFFGAEHVPRVGQYLYVARTGEDDLYMRVEAVTVRYRAAADYPDGKELILDYVVVQALGLPPTNAGIPVDISKILERQGSGT